MPLTAVTTDEFQTQGRRTVVAILAEIESQCAGYHAKLQGCEAETRQLLSKIAALESILDSPAVRRETKGTQ
tara:strand:+ start:707 stop:922 length:216 start_codon:yes stop_codon:yes gene_type:complete